MLRRLTTTRKPLILRPTGRIKSNQGLLLRVLFCRRRRRCGMSSPPPSAIDLESTARHLGLSEEKVRQAVALLDDGNTIPFITRYRKDQTGGLDEVQLRSIQQEVLRRRYLEERRQAILRSIDSRSKLTPELAELIKSASNIKQLEDLYLPFKPKKQSLATVARERGLQPLADEVYQADAKAADLETRAGDFVDVDKKLPSTAEVLLGAGHILAERLSERADIRAALRNIMNRTGKLVSKRIAPPDEIVAEPTQQVAAEKKKTPVEKSEDAPKPTPDVPKLADDTEASASETTAAPPDLASPPEESAAEPSTSVPSASGDAASPPEKTTTETVTKETNKTKEESNLDSSVEQAKPEATPPKRKKKKKKKKKESKDQAYKDYFDFEEKIGKLPPHRVLAINRGEREKMLRVRVESDIEQMLAEAEKLAAPEDHPHAEFLRGCARDAVTRLVLPSLQREMRRELTERAEQKAVQVFAKNLRNLLLQPPVHGRVVLAIDPGYRSGCKLAVVDAYGNLLEHGLMHIVGKPERQQKGRADLIAMVQKHGVSVIAIGNGTAGRPTEQLVAKILSDELKESDVSYLVVNEAGASVYSTSTLGREELPDNDPTIRSAISIGRRLLDPLSELVKINPANIGVGLYQHDVGSKPLRDSLDDVVESCVNHVGVNVNTASPALLRYVSGLNQLSSRKLVEYRREHGPFRNRTQFKEVPGIGHAAFVQSAGFLKIIDGDHPLDATWIHPESYAIAEQVLGRMGGNLTELAPAVPKIDAPPSSEENLPVAETPPPAETPEAKAPVTNDAVEASPVEEVSDQPSVEKPSAETPPASPLTAGPRIDQPVTAPCPPFSADRVKALSAQAADLDLGELSSELKIGSITLLDIVEALTRPTRDPRAELPPPLFRRGVMTFDDLEQGMELAGTVLNVVDFGAFVDIGMGESGLVHISRLADRYVRDPHEIIGVGDTLRVWVMQVDKERRRVSLTAIKPGTEKPPEQRGRRQSSTSRPAKTGKRPGGRRYEGKRAKKATRPQPQKTYRTRTKVPAKPITKAMKVGKEPMRTFGDLAQFFDPEEDSKKEKGKEKGKKKE